MVGAPVVIPESAQLGPGEVRGHVERRIGEGAAEMSGLSIVAEQRESHAGHVANVFQPLALVGQLGGRDGQWRSVNAHLGIPTFRGPLVCADPRILTADGGRREGHRVEIRAAPWGAPGVRGSQGELRVVAQSLSSAVTEVNRMRAWPGVSPTAAITFP